MVIKICGEHGYREQGDCLEDLECPGCAAEEDEENLGNPFEEMENL